MDVLKLLEFLASQGECPPPTTMKKLLISAIAVSSSLFTAQAATSLLTIGDTIVGGQILGGNFEIGSDGFVEGENQWPVNESPNFAIDGLGQKYLNFGETNTGVVVTPGTGQTIATSLQVWAANDAEPRDPSSYAVYGTNVALSGSEYATADFTLISSGALSLPATRNNGGSSPLNPASMTEVIFANAVAYDSYMIVFPTVKNASSANSMQIAELQLVGTEFQIAAVPEPSSTALLGLGGLPLLLRRRR